MHNEQSEKVYSHDEIPSIIPNLYPLMFLDELTIVGDSAKGIIELKDDTWFFACHYPDNPIMPMSLLIESMTQTFSAIFLSQRKTKEIPVISSISGSNGAIKLKESAGPGDTIIIEATLSSFRRGIAKGTCKAFKNGKEDSIMEIDIVEVLPSEMVRMT